MSESKQISEKEMMMAIALERISTLLNAYNPKNNSLAAKAKQVANDALANFHAEVKHE